MNPLDFLNNAVKSVVNKVKSPARKVGVPIVKYGGDAANAILYGLSQKDPNWAEAGLYGAGTYGTSSAISRAVRAPLGPDVAVGVARGVSGLLSPRYGDPINDALAPLDVDEYIKAVAQLVTRGELRPKTVEQARKAIEIYKPVGETLRHYGAMPGL